MISLKHLDLFAHRSGVADRTLAEREVLIADSKQGWNVPLADRLRARILELAQAV